MKQNPRIAIIGAGLGGTAGAALMAKAGFNIKVYEQAPAFARIGAGIHLGPNVMKVMRAMGIEDELNRIGAHPDYWYSRDGITGEVMAQIPLGDYALSHYGASYLTVHRGDFHKLMTDALPPGILEFNKKLSKVEDLGDKVVLNFADGTTEEADIVVGADGINSKIRDTLLGSELPKYTGYVAHRAVFPTPLDSGTLPFDMCCKWWAGNDHMMVYFVTSKKDEIYYVTGVPESTWDMSKSWEPCSKDEMRRVFGGWHSSVQALIEGTQEVSRWPLLERDPLPLWSRGRMVLLGDACHPMKPHMAQGAAMAIEDAAILTRCFQEMGFTDLDAVFNLYEANRAERASKVQLVSHNNTWLKTNENPDWCFGYDVFTTPLVDVKKNNEQTAPAC